MSSEACPAFSEKRFLRAPQGRIFFEGKNFFFHQALAGLAGHQRWRMEECSAHLVVGRPPHVWGGHALRGEGGGEVHSCMFAYVSLTYRGATKQLTYADVC